MSTQRKIVLLILFYCLFFINGTIWATIHFDAPPIDTYKFNHGQGIIFPGGSSTLTYDSCSNDTLSYGFGSLYSFWDRLPCGGDAIGTMIGCTEGCCLYPLSVYVCIGANPYPYKYYLILSGDIGNEKFYVHAGNTNYYEAGEYENVDLIGSISLGSLSDDIKDGKVDFTFMATIREYQCNDECQTVVDSDPYDCYLDNCDCSQADERPLFVVKGTLTVSENPREDFDLFNILFAPSTALTGLSSYNPTYYDVKDFPFTRSYDDGRWNSQTCQCDEYIETENWLISRDIVTHRVKSPGWQEDVWIADDYFGDDGCGLPSYMSKEGWNCQPQKKQVSLYLGSFGTIYFNHGVASDDSDRPESYLLSWIKHCKPGQDEDHGEIIWRFDYCDDPSGKKYICCIYNGDDPNYPELSPQFYRYSWNTSHSEVQQEYYNTTINSNNPLRVSNVSFDAKGRVVESTSGCRSGCGGSSYGYEKLEYDDQFEDYDDLIKKKYNSNGDIVAKNDYQVFRYGKTWPAYPITTLNASFEVPNVNDGYYQDGNPDSWEQTNDPNYELVRIYDPNQIQWDARYDVGESVPDRNQILTLMGGAIQQNIRDFGIVTDTTYLMEVDTGAFIDPNVSQATIKLLAYDPNDPTGPAVELMVMDVDENSTPNGFGFQLDEGKWVTQGGIWDSSENPELVGWHLRILLEGDYVDIDNLTVSASTFIGGETKPLLVCQMAEPDSPAEPNMLFVTWDYDSNHDTAVERRWVDNQTAKVVKYYYEDDTFSEIIAKTEYENLNENPDEPNGLYYTTYYQLETEAGSNDSRLTMIYPSGKRKDVEKRTLGLATESYTEDLETGTRVNFQSYTYLSGKVKTHTDARGGVTEYNYYNDQLTQQKDPLTAAGQRITNYYYDGARRMTYEKHQDSGGAWIRTSYNYNATTGFLDSVIMDDDDGEFPDQHIGKKVTTQYVYNDFGQVTREISPDGIVTGKSYGLGGQVTSDFTLVEDVDYTLPDPNLMLVSQTCYYYDMDGRIEYVKKVKSDSTFYYSDPDDPDEALEWIVTQYQYDFLGRKTAVIEDVDGLALKTEYKYNNQGEVEKVTLPNGKWTETHRNGRGQVITQIIGHDDLDSDKWQVTEFEYDANGNLKVQVASDGIRTVYEYDNVDRLKKVKRGAEN